VRIYNNDRDKYSGRRSGGGGGSRFGGRSRGGRSDGPVTMHPAVCDACGRDCEVPFRPSGDKPIYCSNCFDKEGGRDSGGRNYNRGDRRPSRDSRNEMFSAVCDDCGKSCEVPFKPSGDKPIYCSRCFEDRGNSHDSGSRRSSSENISNENSELLNTINTKLDTLITLLETKSVEKKVTVKKTPKKRVTKAKKEKVTKE
jgi:CxxC-x17-CxxC domain-containing protein